MYRHILQTLDLVTLEMTEMTWLSTVLRAWNHCGFGEVFFTTKKIDRKRDCRPGSDWWSMMLKMVSFRVMIDHIIDSYDIIYEYLWYHKISSFSAARMSLVFSSSSYAPSVQSLRWWSLYPQWQHRHFFSVIMESDAAKIQQGDTHFFISQLSFCPFEMYIYIYMYIHRYLFCFKQCIYIYIYIYIHI